MIGFFGGAVGGSAPIGRVIGRGSGVAAELGGAGHGVASELVTRPAWLFGLPCRAWMMIGMHVVVGAGDLMVMVMAGVLFPRPSVNVSVELPYARGFTVKSVPDPPEAGVTLTLS